MTTKTKGGTVEKTGPSSITRGKTYVRSVLSELKKVHWPNRKQLMGYSAIVFLAVILCAIVIWLYDVGISFILELINKSLGK